MLVNLHNDLIPILSRVVQLQHLKFIIMRLKQYCYIMYIVITYPVIHIHQ